jgi:hypothetical protein
MKNVAPERMAGRSLAAQLAASAQDARVRAGDRSCTDRALARRWHCHHDRIASLFRPASGASIAFGDVLALPVELAREILVRALAALEPGRGPGPRETVDRLAIELGRAVHVLMTDLGDDGRLRSHEEHAALFARIAAIALRGQSAAERAAQGAAP